MTLVIKKFEEEQDVKVKFMHLKSPSKFYYWSRCHDICFIPNYSILLNISAPTAFRSAHNYLVSKKDEKLILQKCG